MPPTVAAEFDVVAPGRGFTMRGWDFTRYQIHEAIAEHRMLNPAMELCSNVCPWNCAFCFTEDPANLDGAKRRLAGELSFADRTALVDAAAALGARTINIVGAGEPTIDPHFRELISHIASRGLTPIIFTEASLKLRDETLVRELFDLGATIVVKMNSLWNEAYQNSVVGGLAANRPRADRYFQERAEALQMLVSQGFNRAEPTRLAFDTIVCKQNVHEVEALHRYARANNIFVLFVGYMPTGRAEEKQFDALSRHELFKVFERLRRIDAEEYGIVHAAHFPYSGGIPCSIRGLGLFVKITGSVFDCPGTTQALGDVSKEALSVVWDRARSITGSFDGGCLPRKLYWEATREIMQSGASASQTRAPVVD